MSKTLETAKISNAKMTCTTAQAEGPVMSPGSGALSPTSHLPYTLSSSLNLLSFLFFFLCFFLLLSLSCALPHFSSFQSQLLRAYVPFIVHPDAPSCHPHLILYLSWSLIQTNIYHNWQILSFLQSFTVNVHPYSPISALLLLY